MLDQGAQLDAFDSAGHTPLILAVIVNRPDVVDLLIDRIQRQEFPLDYLNILDNTEAGQEKKTALEWAIQMKREDIAKKLQSAGAK